MINKVSITPNSQYKSVSTGGSVDTQTVANVVTPSGNFKVKAAALGSSALFSLSFLFALARKQHGAATKFKHLFKIDFQSPVKTIGLATSATVGGLLGGLAADKKKMRKHKLKEGIHQFLGNILIPISIVGLIVNFVEKKNISNVKKKIYSGLGSIAGVAAGVTIGNKIASKVNAWIFKEDDSRKISAKDFGIHIDDIMAWLALSAKGETVKNFISKALPVVFLLCGYEAGTGTDKSGKN